MPLLKQAELSELIAFGREAQAGRLPAIGVNGVIVPGRFAVSHSPGEEGEAHEHVTRTGSGGAPRLEAGSRQGRQAQAAEAGEAAHAVRRVIQQDLDELYEYHPQTETSYSSSGHAIVNVPVRLFESLPYRARVVLEVPVESQRIRLPPLLKPVDDPDEPRARSIVAPIVPDVRTWAVWDDGVLITSHHQFPDQSICSFMPGEWLLGVHSLDDLVGIVSTWVAKVLHERLVGFWPGPQHAVDLALAMRDRADEYCGCARKRRYGTCCRPRVTRMSPYELWSDALGGRRQYLFELQSQGREPRPPFRFATSLDQDHDGARWLTAAWPGIIGEVPARQGRAPARTER
jgi:hypothetical protein